MNSELKNNILKMQAATENNTLHDIWRLGTVEQRSTAYRRNGMLNFGAQQMISFGQTDFFSVEGGGPPIVGA